MLDTEPMWVRGCYIWSRGLYPTARENICQKLSSKSDNRVKISGSIGRYDALVQRAEMLRSFYSFYVNNMHLVIFLQAGGSPKT